MNFDEAKKKSVEFFNGDELAADVFLKKYAMTNKTGDKYTETTPLDMWKRLAEAAASVEKDKKYWEEQFLNILKDFKAVPQGSILFSLGNKIQKSSNSNCFVFKVEDSLESIFETAKEMARTYSYRGGCGLDLSTLRPSNALVTNAAKSSSGAASFMEFFSNVTRMIGISGRRGALMLSLGVDHPDIELFVKMKNDLKKVTGANVSVRILDSFMKAVEHDKDWVTEFKTKHETITRKWKAKDLWKTIVDSATKTAEPGLMFWDTIINNSPADCYSDVGFKTISSNPCQPAWAEVLTKQGIRQFKDISVGDEIWSETGWTKILNKMMTGIKKVYKYETTAGVFYGTENHRVLSNGIKVEIKNAESIDLLAGSDCDCENLDPQDIMDGLIIGDGSVHKANNNLVYLIIGKDDRDYFNSEIKDFILSNYSDELSFKIKTTILNNELSKTYNRSIPDRFYFGNENKVCGFLRGLYSANGSICGDRVTLKASSKELILQTQVMLSSIGIRSYITTNKSTDVKFNNGNYTCKESYDLNVTTDRVRFASKIGFIQRYKDRILSEACLRIVSLEKRKTHDIKSIELLGEEEVFDITVDNEPHTYWSAGLNISNCSELPLSNHDSCTLLSMNLTKYTRNDFTDRAVFDEESFFKDVKIATRFLDNVKTIDADCVPLEQQKVVSKNGRRIGMGIHGLADTLANLTIKYDSKDGVNFIDKLFEKYTKAVYGSSVELAKEKGEFPVFDKKKEKGHLFLDRIGFAGVPRRNIACMTLAPTGTVSLLSQTSSGIEPVFRNSYKRRVKINHNSQVKEGEKVYIDALGDKWLEYDVHHHNVERYFKLTGNKELPDYFVTSDQIDWKKRVQIQAVITNWLDHSCSSTINLPKGTTSETVGDIYFEAWRSGCKGITVYVDGCRDGVLITDDEKPKKKERIAIERPAKIPCDIYQIQADGSKWIVIVGLVNGKPYEVFCGKPNKIDIGKVEEGYIEKEAKGKYSLHIGSEIVLRDISDIFTDTQAAMTRLISTSLRHDVDMQFIVQQLEKSDGTIYSFNKAISRVLKKYIKDGTKEEGEKCPSCGAESIIRQNGCVSCSSCGWTKC